jgi:hypothetical protein
VAHQKQPAVLVGARLIHQAVGQQRMRRRFELIVAVHRAPLSGHIQPDIAAREFVAQRNRLRREVLVLLLPHAAIRKRAVAEVELQFLQPQEAERLRALDDHLALGAGVGAVDALLLVRAADTQYAEGGLG